MNTAIEESSCDMGIQLVSLQYTDLENAILTATQAARSGAYTVKLREDEYIEYGRLSLLESTNSLHQSLTSTYDALVRLPFFEAWPVFADSLLSTEVAVSTPCASSIDISKPTAATYTDEEDSDRHCTTALYYKLHQPLPGYLGKQLYRSGTHIVAMLSKATDLIISESPLVQSLIANLKRASQHSNVRHDVLLTKILEYDGSKGGRLANRPGATTNTERYRLAHLCHRLNVIGKSDIVLCDSSGVAVDAIRANVPAVFLSSIPKGFEQIQQCVVDYLEHGNRQRLIIAQTHALYDTLFERSAHCHVMSGQKSLSTLVRQRVNELNSLYARFGCRLSSEGKLLAPEILSGKQSTSKPELILHSQQSLCVEPEKSVKLKSGLESSRRKFQKFRESPVRFMEDSQNRLLRSLVTTRAQ